MTDRNKSVQRQYTNMHSIVNGLPARRKSKHFFVLSCQSFSAFEQFEVSKNSYYIKISSIKLRICLPKKKEKPIRNRNWNHSLRNWTKEQTNVRRAQKNVFFWFCITFSFRWCCTCVISVCFLLFGSMKQT